MAPKKKKYSVDLRQTVIKHYPNDHSEHEIAQKLIIPRNSVHYIIDKYKKKKQNAFKILSVEAENVRPLYILTELYSEK